MTQAGAIRLQLRWVDPVTGSLRTPVLSPPIALGREFQEMPGAIADERVSRIVLDSSEVSRYHALLAFEGSGLMITDRGSRSGIRINGTLQARSVLANGDILQIGPYEITIFLLPPVAVGQAPPFPPQQRTIIPFHPTTDVPDAAAAVGLASGGSRSSAGGDRFPPAWFDAKVVSLAQLQQSGLALEEKDFVAVGAGLGSFMWVDALRLSGVQPEQIMALGMEEKPYARYERLCLNSQIPPHERLRSNSDSCPDNIWGWPSYALREAWHDLTHGKIGPALGYLWQVFSEPDLAPTYTPRSGNVFAAIDREAERIGWSDLYRYGRVRAIRQTEDGRYAIAYSRSTASRRDHAIAIATYVHLATGYPAIQFLPDLQTYRERTQDFKSVVNAYEHHEHIYEQLQHRGGTVMLRGRGIVASRILQRLYEVRQQNDKLYVLHLMRSPKPEGHRFGKAQRQVKHHFEFQPFNWPKACWGGELRDMLEQADPMTRKQLLADWGGTTTADRRDWRKMIDEGLRQGWYRLEFGDVIRVERDPQQHCVLTTIQARDLKGEMTLTADYVIDATGMEAEVKASPLLDDLVSRYQLPLNPLGRLTVSNTFELVELRAQPDHPYRGCVYAAGALTLGGPYAAVDSFLGLQYAALCSVEELHWNRAPRVRSLNGWRSLVQWVKWALNQEP
jgi:pSer/pThr/pTyr-binding forkhead associated (FHA) protein